MSVVVVSACSGCGSVVNYCCCLRFQRACHLTCLRAWWGVATLSSVLSTSRTPASTSCTFWTSLTARRGQSLALLTLLNASSSRWEWAGGVGRGWGSGWGKGWGRGGAGGGAKSGAGVGTWPRVLTGMLGHVSDILLKASPHPHSALPSPHLPSPSLSSPPPLHTLSPPPLCLLPPSTPIPSSPLPSPPHSWKSV